MTDAACRPGGPRERERERMRLVIALPRFHCFFVVVENTTTTTGARLVRGQETCGAWGGRKDDGCGEYLARQDLLGVQAACRRMFASLSSSAHFAPRLYHAPPILTTFRFSRACVARRKWLYRYRPICLRSSAASCRRWRITVPPGPKIENTNKK